MTVPLKGGLVGEVPLVGGLEGGDVVFPAKAAQEANFADFALLRSTP